MEVATLKQKFLKDYQESDFSIKETHLDFTIEKERILVKADLHFEKKNKNTDTLVLDGKDLETLSVKINNLDVPYTINNNQLEVHNIKEDSFILTTEVSINPYTNTTLNGIYKSSSCICSQCEPEGFRSVTWYLDRPDVMSVWYVSISAPAEIETLLSNGNKTSEKVENNIRTCTFHDICPKPSYLFAFVAGNFDYVHDIFTTRSNRKVDLFVYVEKGKKDQAYFALESLKKSMKWDEDAFDLEYELDVFSIVAVSDFNMGAMENKSLNIFNDSLVLATPSIATDNDYYNIESVIAHEYFHNFTGNRITCKNWFQLTLKEGLTVYRDNRFSEDLYNTDIVRIRNVIRLKESQFPEDASNLSHPIRPTSYVQMNNFYTATVYEKGAEVIRMIETIIGRDTFKKGIDIYFENFDGQAVTCEDFLWSMEQASGLSLEDFKKWYYQSGTPILNINTQYLESNNQLKITVKQINNPTYDQSSKENLVIPIKIAIISDQKISNEQTIILDKSEDTYTIDNVPENAVLSTNRFFSAPVIINYDQSDEDLVNIIKYETDGYAKYEAMQSFITKYLRIWIDHKENGTDIDNKQVDYVIDVYKDILDDYATNPHLTSLLISLPTITSFEIYYKKDFPLESIHYVLNYVAESIASKYEKHFFEIFLALQDEDNVFSEKFMGIRTLKNTCLYFLCKSSNKDNYIKNAVSYYYNSNNMTKKMGAILAIRNLDISQKIDLFNDFYEEYKTFPTVINKFFFLQSTISKTSTLDIVKQLTNHEAFSFTNPNNVRYLIGAFMQNHVAYHNLDGSGYEFIGEMILKLDKINPFMAAHLARNLIDFNMHKQERKSLIKNVINNIISKNDLSEDLLEILSK